jgi:hypothetical protein
MHARTPFALATSALFLLACGDPTSTAGRSVPPASPHAPMESPAPTETDWITLFDGTDPAAQWRGFRQAEFPSGWEVRDGCLVHVGPGGGDIVTRRAFGSFELELDWKVTPGGNSGIFYHVREDMPNTWETGPEMQILDDGTHQDGKDRLTCAGADYALYPAPLGAVKPVGQWNRARILVEGMHVRYWLNGVKTADFVRGSDDWKARVAASKFSTMPGYAKHARGHIALQDHGDEVWFRNIRVRALD